MAARWDRFDEVVSMRSLHFDALSSLARLLRLNGRLCCFAFRLRFDCCCCNRQYWSAFPPSAPRKKSSLYCKWTALEVCWPDFRLIGPYHHRCNDWIVHTQFNECKESPDERQRVAAVFDFPSTRPRPSKPDEIAVDPRQWLVSFMHRSVVPRQWLARIPLLTTTSQP